MTLFKYDHVHLRSPDPEATAQFYENMFGAEVSRGLYPAGTPFAGKPRITMKLGGTSFYIAPPDPRTPNGDSPNAPHFGLEHIGLTVDNLDSAAAELKNKRRSLHCRAGDLHSWHQNRLRPSAAGSTG